jgi:hypothetical protein
MEVMSDVWASAVGLVYGIYRGGAQPYGVCRPQGVLGKGYTIKLIVNIRSKHR